MKNRSYTYWIYKNNNLSKVIVHQVDSITVGNQSDTITTNFNFNFRPQ